MRRYDEAFAEVGLTVAQVLITHADLADRERVNNARHAMAALLEAGAVPIVNENDTLATDEIRFGDNDQLAAMVSPLVGAELLVLLTDVEGVLDARGRRISVMDGESEVGSVRSSAQRVGSGGMASKLDAARKASRSGASVVIAPAGHANVLSELLDGKDVGTLFPCSGPPLKARKHWIMFTLRPRGTLLLDDGAVQAMRGGKASLLPIGVLGVRGQFNPGDSVRLVAPDGSEVGRGLTRFGALDVARAAGRKGSELELLFGAGGADLVIVHKDDLVVTA
jgi:glutamate 5-kinase